METTKERIIKVWAVDDSETSLNDLIVRLYVRDVDVTAFSTGEELLSKLASIHETEELPTAILMDYILRNNNSEPIIEKLREQYPRLPIIIYSGLDLRGSIKAYGMGAYAVMQKPLDFSELAVILKELANTDALTTGLAMDLSEITEFETCLLWQWDKKSNDFKVTGFHGADREFVFNTRMDENSHPRIKAFKPDQYRFYQDVTSSNENEKQDYKDPKIALKRGWKTLIALPFFRENRLMGWFDCYSRSSFNIKGNKEKKLGILQKYAIQAGEALHSTLLTKQSRIIHEISQNLAIVSDENLVYDTILEKAIEFTGADWGWIYTHNIEKKRIECIRYSGEGAEKADTQRPLRRGGIIGLVVILEHSVYVPDIGIPVVNWYLPGMHVPTHGLEEKSVIAIPLRRGERTLGVLALSSRRGNFFTPDESQLLTSLAAIAAVGMERSKLTKHLNGLSNIARSAKDFIPIAEHIVNAVRDLTHADVNFLMTRVEEEDGDNFLRIVASSKKDKKYIEEYIKNMKIPNDPNKGVSAYALYHNRHKIVKDIESYTEHPPFFTSRKIKKYHWRSFMSVPVIGNNGERLGLISLYSKLVDRFNDDEGQLVQHFANQAAQALQEQRRTKVFQELARASQELAIGLPGVDVLLRKVAKLARDFAKADITVLYPYDSTNNKYYDADSVAIEGVLKVKKQLTNKPRENGLGAFIRKYEALVVEDLEGSEISMYLGLDNPQKCLPGTAEHDLPTRLIRESSFIERERIKAFIGVSLQAKEIKGSDKDDVQHEVAILYFNYHAPRRFSSEELQFIDIFCRQVANIIHRNRLFYSLQRERQVLDAVHHSTLHILEEHQEEQLLEKIVEEAVQLLQGAGGKIYMTINGSQKDLKLAASKGLPPDRIRVGHIMSNSKGMAGEVLRTRKPVIVDDYAIYPKRITEFEDLFTAVLEVPMKIGEEVIGVLGVFDNNQKRKFKQKDAEILSRLAAQAALAITNLKLKEELSVLYQTGLQITAQAPLKRTTENILAGLEKVIEYDKATIQSIQDAETPRKILAFGGIGKASTSAHLLRPVKEDKLVWPIYQNKTPYILSDTHKNSDWEKNHNETKNVRSWACLPLVYGGAVLGLLILDHKQPGYYTDQDLPKLERFANQAAIALHNASLEQKLITILGDFSKFAIRVISEEKSKEHVFNEMLESINNAIESAQFVFYPTDHKYLVLQEGGNLQLKPLTMGEGIVGWVAQEKEVKLIPADAPVTLLPKKKSGMQQKLYGPLLKAGETIGVLEISSTDTEFDDFHKGFLGSLLTIAANAIYQIEHKERKVEAIKADFNPYIVGPPIRDPQKFYGRAEILQKIINGIHNNSYIIADERRLGKSSVLHQLKYHLGTMQTGNPLFFSIYIDLEGINENAFWRRLFVNINYEIGGAVPVNIPETLSFHEFMDNVDFALNELEKKYASAEIAIVLLLDEFDVFNGYNINTLAYFRKLFQEEGRMRTVLAGKNIKDTSDDNNSPWHNFLLPLKLSELERHDALSLILGPVSDIYSYGSDAIELILDKSEYRPYPIQGICFFALQHMLKRAKENNLGLSQYSVLKEDVELAFKEWKMHQ